MWFKRKKTMNELKLGLKQKKIGKLIEAMLASDTEIHFAPISKEYFIVDKKNKIHICISEDSVRVANHEYLYEVSLSGKIMSEYMSTARKKVEEKTKLIKKELFKNELDLIDKIKNIYIKQ